MRRRISHTLGLLALVALVVGIFAGPAPAKKMSAKQKAAITKQLRKAVKKNPKAIYKASFLKKARAVDFVLPATIRVQRALNSAGDPANNTGAVNSATLDLGPSLGTRTLGLGGKLPAQIEFSDSFDGGGLGNVRLDLPSGGAAQGYGLRTTSIPLLTNADVTNNDYDPTPFPADSSLADGDGCAGWTATPFNFGGAGVDDPAALLPSNNPGNNNLGAGAASPESADVQDTVLRTSGLNLVVGASGTPVTLPGGRTMTLGKSGGTANLFGNIPGKSTDIDVTASLTTKINSILREVDATAGGQTPLNLNDPDGLPSNGDGDETTSGNDFVAFNCRQAITGGVDNFLTGIRLNGDLKISPAITADGKLRIAKATLGLAEPAPLSVAACLVPYTSYAVFNPGFNVAQAHSPFVAPGPYTANTAASPVFPGAAKSIASGATYTLPAAAPFGGAAIPNAYDVPCGAIDPVLTAFGVDALSAPATPFTTTDNGSAAKVAATLTSLNLDVDVLIGAV